MADPVITANIPQGYSYDASGKLTNNAGQPYVPPTTPPPVTPAGAKPVDLNAITQNQNNGSISPTAQQSGTTSPQGERPLNGANYDPNNNYGIGATTQESIQAPFGRNPNGVPYGSQNSNDPNPNASVYSSSGNATGSVTGNQNTDSLIAAQKDLATKAQTFSDTIAGITNGSIPLNPGQQAQIDGLKQQFQQLISQQTLVNSGATGTANIRGYQGGAAEYDPNFQVNNVNSVMAAGANKIANLQTQEASAVASLTQSLQNNNIAAAKSAFDAYQTANAATQESLKTAIAATKGAINDAHIASVLSSGITDPKQILLKLQQQGYNDISSADVTAAIKNLSPDAAEIYNTAQTATQDGASPDTVALIMGAPDKATALKILSQSGVANSGIKELMTKYPDAGIVPGDTLQQANTKIQASPTYSLAQKNQAADLAYKRAQTAQLMESISGNSTVTSKPTVEMTANNTPNEAQQTQFLAALPSDLATLVKGIANYQINPSSVPSRNYKGVGGLTQSQVLTLVSQYDPTFSQQNYASRQALMTNFASGKYSQNVNSLNTAVGHISDILDNFSGLGNAGFTPYNAAKNEIATLFGSGNAARAGLNINAATSEIASTFKGTGATDEEIKALGTLDANSSPDQVKAYVETATQLLASRLQALQDTYTSGIGKAPTNSFLSPTSQQALLKLQQQGLNIKVPQLADSPLVKIQTFHDASADNAKLLDGIMANHPEFGSDPQKAIDFLNQQGINL